MSSFDDVLSSTPAGPGAFALEIQPGWLTGRGAFGGLVIGAMTRAITDTVGEATPLRSLTAAIPSPVEVGAAELRVRVVRAGSAVTTATCELHQAGELRAVATAVLARARDGAARVQWRTQAMPSARPWRDLPSLPMVPGLSPPFTAHLDFRLSSPMPFTRQAEATFLGYVAPKTPALRRDAALLVALADAYLPAAHWVFAGPRPTATSAFTIELVEPFADLDPGEPLLVRGHSPAAQDGYSYETRELWGEDGRLVARNHQTFVIIK